MDYLPRISVLVFQVFVIWVSWITSIRAELRCYCNLPVCVSTGYMCKTSKGACFTKINNEMGLTLYEHGCSDDSRPSWMDNKDNVCSKKHRSRHKEGKWPKLLCCKKDMCNYYKDNVELRLQEIGSHTANKTRTTPTAPKTEIDPNDLWFKAAVIAVPIAGACILVLLILLAVRMLRKDSRRHMQLLQLRRQRAQLFVSDHLDYFPTEKVENIVNLNKQNHMYKNVNIVAQNVPAQDEKPLNDKTNLNNIYSSVLVWGNEINDEKGKSIPELL